MLASEWTQHSTGWRKQSFHLYVLYFISIVNLKHNPPLFLVKRQATSGDDEVDSGPSRNDATLYQDCCP